MKKNPLTILLFLALITIVSLSCAPEAPVPAPAPKPAPAPAPAPAPKPAPAPAPKPVPAPPAKVNLTMGGSHGGGALHAWYIALARVMNRYSEIPVSVTVVEASSWMNLHKLDEKKFDLVQAGFTQGWTLYTGAEGSPFEGKPNDSVRAFAYREVSYHHWWVTQASGIKSISDLKGKKFGVGAPGGLNQQEAMAANEVLGLGMEEFIGSYNEAADAVKDGRLVGAASPSTPWVMPSYIMSVHLTKPMTLVGFTEEEARKIHEKYPMFILSRFEVGTMKELPEVGGFYTFTVPAGLTADTRLPEELGYSLMKAVYEHYDDIEAAYPGCSEYDPITAFTDYPKDVSLPLHAGVVRYAKEKGIEIKDYLIPPEYK